MINYLYQLTNKGSWRALSFTFAICLTFGFFFNLNGFATAFRTQPAYWVLGVLWAIISLWIHGFGFQIKSPLWRLCFLPIFGYLITTVTVIQHLLSYF